MDAAYRLNHVDDFGEEPAIEAPPPVIGTAERRMNVRAYEHWVSLLDGRSYPAIADLEFGGLGDMEPRSVLIDFTRGIKDPLVTRIGRTLREECGASGNVRSVADVPRGSLLSRLTDHFLEIIGTRAPIGFEAEFSNHQKLPTLYRGILMPFSSDGRMIDHVLGVINWKHGASPDLAESLQREMSGLGGWVKPALH